MPSVPAVVPNLIGESERFREVLRLRRVIESDPDLKLQLEAAAQVFKKDQQNAKDSETIPKTLQQGALAELDVLAKLLA